MVNLTGDHREDSFVTNFSACNSLCDRYDNIASKVYEDSQTTEDMVELVQFLAKVRLLIINYYKPCYFYFM